MPYKLIGVAYHPTPVFAIEKILSKNTLYKPILYE